MNTNSISLYSKASFSGGRGEGQLPPCPIARYGPVVELKLNTNGRADIVSEHYNK